MEIKRVVVTGMGLHMPPSATEKYGCCRPIGGQNRSGVLQVSQKIIYPTTLQGEAFDGGG
jgi:hypothetical protein